ncbi:tetratricopeptide repeat protein [Nonomuraea phyllanthi]|uniref:ATP-binding protein n=1 Tax=Nonomuraea phyllanthi TaxID=2219224 RepID=UPI0012939227|nr:tetratricopeptide repeat protein [Nonomuraea phyllanthi]QFY07440.1 tetratricopeptide repeat protein [Nonomuraea phyllanthi]
MSSGTSAGNAAEQGSSLAGLLRGWRERALLTQEQLAALAGLNARTIRRLEAGELQRPRSASLRSLAEALHLDGAERSLLAQAVSEGGPAVSDGGPAPAHPAPRQLPADVAAFVGRARELAVLDEIGQAATVVITAIDGMAGVGKTALAVHAAHQLAPRFPDGHLFVDLHGYTRGKSAADPADTLTRMLTLLGVPGEAIPPHLDDRAAMYRSVLAGRQMLIVLDNAADEAQVGPLMPGAGGCLVLITSRRRLIGLDGARTISVDVLPPADAVSLFAGTAGEQRLAGASEQALAEVVHRCGLLPLAIRLAAARLKAHPAWTVTHLLRRLDEHRHPLAELRAGQRSVTAALDLSYRELPAADQRAYRLLGLHPGADIALDAVAALLDTTAAHASTLLDHLLESHLLHEPTPGRYRFHDLIRAHSAHLATVEESASEQQAAVTRLLVHYGQAASIAVGHLYPYEADTRPHPPAGAAGAADIPDAEAAISWLDAELANLLDLARHAAEHGFPDHVQYLSATLHRCLRTRGHYTEAEDLHTRALATARTTANVTGEMEALLALGEIRHRQNNRYDLAMHDTTQALAIARGIEHRSGELRALNTLGMLDAVRGRYAESAEHFTRALDISRAIGHRTGELDALIGSGHIHRVMGQHEQALDNLRQALGIARTIGHRTGEVRTLLGLGHVHLTRGEDEAATDCFTRALELARDTEHRLGELDSLTALGDLHRAGGRHQQARDCYQHAFALAREIGNRNWQFEAVHSLGRLQHDCGRPDQALVSHGQALALASDLDQPGDQARAHDGLAHAHVALGQPGRARHDWTRALAILTELGTDQTDERGVDVASIKERLARLAPADPAEQP